MQNPSWAGAVLLNEYRSPLTLAKMTWIWSKCIRVQPAAAESEGSSSTQRPGSSSVLAASSCGGDTVRARL